MLTRNSIACWIFGLAICVFLAQPIAGKTIYVDADATGANDGSSWENAYNHLQDALADANSSAKPVQIRVAQGIYKPDQGVGITPGDREATFQLISGVAIRGGYAGFGEPDPNTRDIECYPTILSGDLIRHDETVTLVAEKAEKRVLVPSGPVMQTWPVRP